MLKQLTRKQYPPNTPFQEPGQRQPSEAFWAKAWRAFRKNKLAFSAFYVVIGLILLAAFADFLAYNKPYYAEYQGQSYYPLFYDYMASVGLYRWDADLKNEVWRNMKLENAVWPPVRYLPGDIDQFNMQAVGPFEQQMLEAPGFRHYLGTDELGRDLMAGLIHGSRISLSIGVIAAGISALIGIFMGSLAGYFGDAQLQASRIKIVMVTLFTLLGFFYAFYVRGYVLSQSLNESFLLFLGHLALSLLIFAALVVAGIFLARPLERLPYLRRKVFVPVDILISRLIELMLSIPILLLIVSIAAIAEPSLFLIMAIIGLTTWTRIARFTRGELLKVRSLEYIQAAQAMGFNEGRIIFRHALPNSLAPVFVAIAFGIAAAIIIESSLSFLGIGVPVDTITWGKLLQSAQDTTGAWWLAVFPGFAIFITVTCFNLVGEGLRDALDPKLKH
jgi:peptide/nickel transport system permease protein